MIPFVILFVISCIITFIIIKIYNLISLKNQIDNFKSATYIYMRKKVDYLPTFLNSIRSIIGDTDDIINVIKLRNDFDESKPMSENMNLLHEFNKNIGIIFNSYPDLAQNPELEETKSQWYMIDATLRQNFDLYKNSANEYNDLFNDFISSIVIKILKFEQENI